MLRKFFSSLLADWRDARAKNRAMNAEWQKIADERREEARQKFETLRLWKFVNAHGPLQSTVPAPMTHAEACKFLRDGLGYPYLETDFSGSIIFFAGPRHGV